MCAKSGSDWFRSVKLNKVQTHKPTNKKKLSALYIRLPVGLHFMICHEVCKTFGAA